MYTIFYRYSRSIRSRVSARDPCARETIATLDRLEAACVAKLPSLASRSCSRWNVATLSCAAVFIATTYGLNQRRGSWGGAMPRITASLDVLLVAVAAFCCVFMLAFALVPFVMDITSEMETAVATGGKKLDAHESPARRMHSTAASATN